MIAKQNPRRWFAALRWGAAALAVATAHGGVAWYAVHWKPAHAEAAAGALEPAIMIELSPVSVAQEAPAETLPPAPQLVEAEQPPPPEPEPVVEPPPLEPEITIPELPKIPDALAVLAPPPLPKPVMKPVERKPPPKPKVVVERKRVERPRQREAAAPPPAQAPAAAPTRANQGITEAPSVSNASWRGSLIAHLNRYKRFPGGARPGTVQVAFSIDRGGRVLSARLAGSSGDALLDEEAVGMIRRASPVPAPPESVGGGGSVSLAVPVRFSR